MRTHVKPLIIAIVALLMLAGGSAAASRYIITSTKQIKPSVLKSLKGNRGQQGPTGIPGPAGPRVPADQPESRASIHRRPRSSLCAVITHAGTKPWQLRIALTVAMETSP